MSLYSPGRLTILLCATVMLHCAAAASQGAFLSSRRSLLSQQCACNRSYMPVCGPDNKLYANKCLAECEGVKLTSHPDSSGKCGASLAPAPAAKPCACPDNLMPVCGVNGKPYDNQCLAECEGVKVLQGAKPLGGKCPVVDPVGPVKPATGASNTNSSATPSPSGPAPGPMPSNPRQPVGQLGVSCGYTPTYEPVCGTDAKWYPNACSVACAGFKVSRSDQTLVVTAWSEAARVAEGCSAGVRGTGGSSTGSGSRGRQAALSLRAPHLLQAQCLLV